LASYSKSIIFTNEEYWYSLELKAKCKEKEEKKIDLQKLEVEKRKTWAAKKLQKDVVKMQKERWMLDLERPSRKNGAHMLSIK
jgi:hypothetical protein